MSETAEKTVVKKDPDTFEVIRCAPGADLIDNEEGPLAIYFCPGDTHYSDGSKGMNIRAPMLIATNWMANQEVVMAKVAEVLSEHYPKQEG